NVAVFPISKTGGLGEAVSVVQHSGSSVNKQRQGEPHAHSINLDPDNRFAIAADLGIDKLLVYHFNSESGALTPNDPPFTRAPEGGGPRHIAFHPDGKRLFANNELSNT